MCASMVDIQSPTAEIRRGKKYRKKKKPQDENIIIWPALLHRAAIKQDKRDCQVRAELVQMYLFLMFMYLSFAARQRA